MKNMIKFFGTIALVAVIGLSMAGCKEDETDPTPQTVTYQGTDDKGVTYTLKITENTARYTAQSGDSYELTVGTRKSNGKVQSVTGGTLTLQPSREGATTFTATVNSSGITAMSGTIAFDVGDPLPAPDDITPPAPPVTGNNPFKGKWTGTAYQDTYTWTFGDTSFEGLTITVKEHTGYVEIKGTYTHTSNAATITLTEAKEKVDNGEWQPSEIPAGYSFTATLSNGKITFSAGGATDVTLTKTN